MLRDGILAPDRDTATTVLLLPLMLTAAAAAALRELKKSGTTAVSEATPNLARGDLLSSNASKSALMIIRGGSCESETSILVRSVNAFASIIADENG